MTAVWRSKVSLARESAGVLGERIFSGHYVPGELLAQQTLAQELGLSRTPLRHALALLEYEGLVRIDQTGRATVTKLSTPQLREALVFRQVLESAGCAMICGRLSDADLDQLERLGDAAQAGDRGAGSRFHVMLVDKSSNTYLQGFTSLIRLTEEVLLPASTGQQLKAHRRLTGLAAALRRSSLDDAHEQLRGYFREQNNLIEAQERPVP
jgi:DNA-binding GntR family transcriptional regulator